MTALLEYIDLFLLNAQKGQIMFSKCQHNSGILVLIIMLKIIPA